MSREQVREISRLNHAVVTTVLLIIANKSVTQSV